MFLNSSQQLGITVALFNWKNDTTEHFDIPVPQNVAINVFVMHKFRRLAEFGGCRTLQEWQKEAT